MSGLKPSPIPHSITGRFFNSYPGQCKSRISGTGRRYRDPARV